MEPNRRYFAYALIAVGAIALLARLSGDAGWLWVGLVSAGFLGYYARERTYGLLVVGAVLAGIALGLLLEDSWGWEGAFLVSLGLGIGAIDRIEPRANRWPYYLGAALVVLGVITGLIESGLLGRAWFALLLIAVGALLLRGGSRGGWTRAPEPPDEAQAPDPQGPAVRAAPRPAPAGPGAGAAEATPGPTADPAPGAPTGPTTGPTTEAATGAVAGPETDASADGRGLRPPPVVGTDPVDPAPTGAGGAAGREDAATAARRAALERWRLATAEREDRAPTMVLDDALVQRLAERAPRTYEELAEVRGIGKVKLERYGDALLEVLATA